jgi:hypothetical protein
MSVYMPIIKLTQRRKGAKNLRTFYYGYATGHDINQASRKILLFTLLRTLREGWRQQNDINSLFCVSPMKYLTFVI